jgi:hypothetical protein
MNDFCLAFTNLTAHNLIYGNLTYKKKMAFRSLVKEAKKGCGEFDVFDPTLNPNSQFQKLIPQISASKMI